MIVVPTYLDKSPIHGFGVYAKAAIKKGDVVWRFNERFDLVLTEEEFAQLPPSVREELEIHMYEPERGRYYYETTMGKYMNHSREPNVDFTEIGLGICTRDVAPNEELLCDYRQFSADWEGIPYI